MELLVDIRRYLLGLRKRFVAPPGQTATCGSIIRISFPPNSCWPTITMALTVGSKEFQPGGVMVLSGIGASLLSALSDTGWERGGEKRAEIEVAETCRVRTCEHQHCYTKIGGPSAGCCELIPSHSQYSDEGSHWTRHERRYVAQGTRRARDLLRAPSSRPHHLSDTLGLDTNRHAMKRPTYSHIAGAFNLLLLHPTIW